MSSFLINPYVFGPPVLWSPAQISTALWLDAADSATLVNTGALINQWSDKSGNNKHVTATGTLRPTYTTSGLNSLGVVTYSGAQELRAASAADWAFLHDGTQYSAFGLWKAGNTSDPNAAYALFSTRSSGPTLGTQLAYDDRASLSRDNAIFHNTGTSGGLNYVVNFSANGVHDANVPNLIEGQGDFGNATASLRSTIRVNESTVVNNNTLTTAVVSGTPQHPLILGSLEASVFPLVGYIAEFLIVVGAVSTDTRQRINGYLAHKWGLTAKLPAGHPYKTTPPYV